MSNNIFEDIKKALVDSMEEAVVTQPSSNISKALRPEVTREQLYAVVEALHEAIEAMLEVPEEDEMETESEDGEDQSEPMDTEEGPEAVGDPEKNEVNWPIAKSLWGGIFSK